MKNIKVSIAKQTLELFDDDKLIKSYTVSTSKHGCGQEENSFKTPLGKHIIRAKIGKSKIGGHVFVSRRPIAKVILASMLAENDDNDYITTKILWLSGCEKGFNRLGNVDSFARYIYIHGTPYEKQLGTPASNGCIRMHFADILDLANEVEVGTVVEINEE